MQKPTALDSHKMVPLGLEAGSTAHRGPPGSPSAPTGVSSLREIFYIMQVEHGDIRAVLGAVREDPRLFTAHCFPGNNTLMHVVARYGQVCGFPQSNRPSDKASELLILLATLCCAVCSSCLQSTMLGALIDEIRDMQARAAAANAGEVKEASAGEHHQHGANRRAAGRAPQSSHAMAMQGQEAGHNASVATRQQGAVPVVGEEEQVVLHSTQLQHQHSNSRQLGKWGGSRQGCGGPGCAPWLRRAVHLDVCQIIDSVNARRQTPLIIAASRGHTDVARQLLELGANPLAADKSEGCTALHYAGGPTVLL
jgi:hypothetical protein